jgi:hypothetical protein
MGLAIQRPRKRSQDNCCIRWCVFLVCRRVARMNVDAAGAARLEMRRALIRLQGHRGTRTAQLESR